MNKNRFILKERILKLNILTSNVRNIKEGNWVRLNKKGNNYSVNQNKPKIHLDLLI